MSLPLSVLSQSGPPKSVGGGGVGGGGRGGVVYHTSTGQYIGVATFFFFENGLEGQKCSVGGLFWGWLPPP